MPISTGTYRALFLSAETRKARSPSRLTIALLGTVWAAAPQGDHGAGEHPRFEQAFDVFNLHLHFGHARGLVQHRGDARHGTVEPAAGPGVDVDPGGLTHLDAAIVALDDGGAHDHPVDADHRDHR